MRAISYAVFGVGKETPDGCFVVESYIRGFAINVIINRILYPEWVNVLNIDHDTYNKYQSIFDFFEAKGLVNIIFHDGSEPLCKKMLWRMYPVFETGADGWKYDHVICRDADSVGTFREAQAVTQWIQEDKAIHCITDSISHNIPMMGGMIGLRPRYVTDNALTGAKTWQQMLDLAPDIKYNRKGSDQDFLNRAIYPKCANSATEHFVLGMVHNLAEGNGRHYSIPDIDVPGVSREYITLNDLGGHIGCSGYYETPAIKFFTTQDPFREEYKGMQRQYPQVFFWVK